MINAYTSGKKDMMCPQIHHVIKLRQCINNISKDFMDVGLEAQ